VIPSSNLFLLIVWLDLHISAPFFAYVIRSSPSTSWWKLVFKIISSSSSGLRNSLMLILKANHSGRGTTPLKFVEEKLWAGGRELALRAPRTRPLLLLSLLGQLLPLLNHWSNHRVLLAHLALLFCSYSSLCIYMLHLLSSLCLFSTMTRMLLLSKFSRIFNFFSSY